MAGRFAERKQDRAHQVGAAARRGLVVPPGLSNSQIADQLIISDATVKTHVARVLMKLNLADRAQAVIFAYETGLVRPGETAP